MTDQPAPIAAEKPVPRDTHLSLLTRPTEDPRLKLKGIALWNAMTSEEKAEYRRLHPKPPPKRKRPCRSQTKAYQRRYYRLRQRRKKWMQRQEELEQKRQDKLRARRAKMLGIYSLWKKPPTGRPPETIRDYQLVEDQPEDGAMLLALDVARITGRASPELREWLGCQHGAGRVVFGGDWEKDGGL